MSFKAVVIFGEGDEATLVKSLVMAVKGLAQPTHHDAQDQFSLGINWKKISLDFQGFQPTSLTSKGFTSKHKYQMFLMMWSL